MAANKQQKNTANEITFDLAGTTLPRVQEVLDVGVNFTLRLNFEGHISIIIAKAKQKLFYSKKAFCQEIPKY